MKVIRYQELTDELTPEQIKIVITLVEKAAAEWKAETTQNRRNAIKDSFYNKIAAPLRIKYGRPAGVFMEQLSERLFADEIGWKR